MLKGDKQSISLADKALVNTSADERGRGGRDRDEVQCPQKNKRKTGQGNTMLLC